MRRPLRVLVAVTAAVLAGGVLSPTAAQADAADYGEYYRYFDTGPAQIPFSDTKWVPQGLTKSGEDRLLISYYDSTGADYSRIAVISRTTGARIKWIKLDTKGHVGGLAMTANYLWVTIGSTITRYSRTAFNNTANERMLYRSSYSRTLPGSVAASYAFAEGETVWVGNFKWEYNLGVKNCPEYDQAEDFSWMWQYRVNSDGTLTLLQDRRTPGAVQGVVVTSSKLIWSTSCGEDNNSRIVVWNRSYAFDANWSHGNVIVAPNMSEGMVIAGGRLQVVYESGSDAYSGADYRVRTVHHGSIPPY